MFLSSKRLNALEEAQNENYDIAILDDGLQDSSCYYDLRFVCFNNINWIGNGLTLPSGPLRENLNNLNKDVILQKSKHDYKFQVNNSENFFSTKLSQKNFKWSET